MVLTVQRKTGSDIQTAGLGNITQRIDTPQGMFGDGGAAANQAASALGQLAGVTNKISLTESQEQNASRSLELENMARKEAMDKMYNPDTGILTRKGGSALGVQAEMETYMEELSKKYADIDGDAPDVKEMVGKSMKSLTGQIVDTARRHQFDQLQTYKADQLTSTQTINTEDAALNYNDEKNFMARWNDNLLALDAQSKQGGWSPQEYSLKKKNLYSSMRSAQITAMAGQNTPDAIIRANEVYKEAQGRNMITFDDTQKMDRFFNSALPEAMAKKAYVGLGATANLTSEDQILNYVIDELEGGDKIADEPNGAIAKFGINSAANPDIDVKNLSREDAVKLYKDRYWTAIGANELPENIRFIAFDTAVNHGVGKAKELIEKANGNPRLLIEARYQEYQKLVKSDPEKYGKYMAGWKQRLADLSGQLTVSPDIEQVQAAAAQLDMEQAGAGAELLALHKRTLENQNAARKADATAFMDGVMPRLYKNNGDWSILTPQEKTKAIELGVWDDLTKYQGVTNPAIGSQVAQMTPEEVMNTDFSDARWRLNMSQNDYESLVKKQADLLQKPASRGEFRTTRDIVSSAWKSIGKKTTDAAYFDFQSSVEDAFAAEMDQRGGKQLTADEKRAVVSRMVMNTSVGAGWFDAEAQKRVYQLDPDATYTISGQTPEVVDSALNVLIQNRQTPSQQNVADFIENPSDFIKVDGYDSMDINQAVQALMRNGVPVNPSTVKSLLEKRTNG